MPSDRALALWLNASRATQVATQSKSLFLGAKLVFMLQKESKDRTKGEASFFFRSKLLQMWLLLIIPSFMHHIFPRTIRKAFRRYAKRALPIRKRQIGFYGYLPTTIVLSFCSRSAAFFGCKKRQVLPCPANQFFAPGYRGLVIN